MNSTLGTVVPLAMFFHWSPSQNFNHEKFGPQLRHAKTSKKSKDIKRYPKTSQNNQKIQRHQKISKDIQKNPKTSKDIQRHPKTFKNIQRHQKTSKDIKRYPYTSKNTQKHPKTSKYIMCYKCLATSSICRQISWMLRSPILWTAFLFSSILSAVYHHRHHQAHISGHLNTVHRILDSISLHLSQCTYCSLVCSKSLKHLVSSSLRGAKYQLKP